MLLPIFIKSLFEKISITMLCKESEGEDFKKMEEKLADKNIVGRFFFRL